MSRYLYMSVNMFMLTSISDLIGSWYLNILMCQLGMPLDLPRWLNQGSCINRRLYFVGLA